MVDGCSHRFGRLAWAVLPGYLRKIRRSMAKPISMRDFVKNGNGPATLAKLHGFHDGDIKGCYVFMDGEKPIYVGISRHVFERLRQHVLADHHLSATLAYQMARKTPPLVKGTAKEAMAKPDFKAEFDRRRQYLQGLNVAVVEIDNAVERYVFEAYCALKLDTGLDNGGWNTFETH